ncbi:MAG: hypothetical protein ACFFCQ_06990, partial [Promethearchaeota archaeon]
IEPYDGTSYGNLRTSAPITILNSAPVAANLTLTPNNPVTSNILIAFYDWEDNDTLDSESGTEIVWYKDGILQHVLNNSFIVPASSTSEGQKWSFAIHPSDGTTFGAWSIQSTNITIENSAPTVNSVTITPSDAKTGNDLTVTYTWADNDTLDSETGTQIRWYLNGTLITTLNDISVVLAGNTSRGDIWHVQVRPSDGNDYGEWMTCLLNLTISNSIPSASNLAITPIGAKTGDNLVANYLWSDTDTGDSESGSEIRWYKNGVLQGYLNNSITVPTGNTTKGETWYFTIEPSDGISFGPLRTSAPITIINTAPTASGLVISPADPNTSSTLSITYLWDDEDLMDIESGTEIIWYKDGILQGTLNDTDIIASSYTAKGEEWHCMVRPSDGTAFGAWFSCPSNITISNTLPTPTSLTIFPTTDVYTTDTLFASFTGTDIDNDAIIGYEIAWFKDNVEVLALANRTDVPSSYTNKSQDWRFEVKLFDGDGWSNWIDSTILSFQSEITILNSPPYLENVILSGGESTNEDIDLSYTYIDPDGDLESTDTKITWMISHMGSLVFPPPSGFVRDGFKVLSNSSLYAGDAIYCIIEPYDGDDYGDMVLSTFFSDGYIIVGNTAPEIVGIPVILGTNFTTMYTVTTTLHVNYSIYDTDSGESDEVYDVEFVDGLVVGAEYRWYRNDELQFDLRGPTVDSSYLNEGDEWKASVRPRDRYGSFGAWVNSTIIEIGNSWPRILDIFWENINPTREDNLTFSYIYFDYDDDPEIVDMVNIYWYYTNGTEITAARNQTSLSQQLNILVKGDEVYVVVSPFDGEHYGLNFSSSVIRVRNALPIATNVVINPNTPFTNEILTLNWNYTDIDEDNEISVPQIRWYRNGILISAFENQTAITATDTSKGEVWWATIQVYDGTDFSLQYLSSTVEIQNTPITISVVEINSNVPDTFADMSLRVQWEYSDQDNDVYTELIILWFKDGVYQTDFTNQTTISSFQLSKGQIWYCLVSLFDGEDWSQNQTSQIITIVNKAPEITSYNFLDHMYTFFLVEDEDIKIFYQFADVDGDSDSSYIRWFKDGIYLPNLDNQTIIYANETQPGEEWFFEIVPFDGINNGIIVTSQNMTIESRPTILGFGCTPLTDYEGHYQLWVEVSDSRNPITEVKLNILSEIHWTVFNGTHWVLDHSFDLSFLDSSVIITGTVTTTVQMFSAEISATGTLNITILDHAPPRVTEVVYFWDDNNPSDITFIAEIEELGSEIDDVLIYYYFRRTKVEDKETEETRTAPANTYIDHIYNNFEILSITQNGEDDIEWQNTAMEPINETHWGVTVEFNPKSDVEILFMISVADSLGNINTNAYPLGLDPEGRQKFKLSTGMDPEFVRMILIVVGIAFVLVIIFSAIAIKKWRTTELVGLDKERVMENITEIPEIDVMSSLDLHTLGIVASFFDQRHGPIPIIVVPEILRDNFDKLVELADHSFSTCQFADNFEEETASSFNFNLAQGVRVNSIAFGFALNRPEARGGAENITLSILVHPGIFPLVNQFIDILEPKVHEIHVLMDKSPHDKQAVLENIIKLRKYISYIVLSYEDLYGTTELITEHD